MTPTTSQKSEDGYYRKQPVDIDRAYDPLSEMEDKESGSFCGCPVSLITALATCAIIVLGCLGIAGTLSIFTMGASIAGLSVGLIAIRMYGEGAGTEKIKIAALGYTALAGILAAAGAMTGVAAGWMVVIPVIACVGPILATGGCLIGTGCVYLPCIAWTCYMMGEDGRARAEGQAERMLR